MAKLEVTALISIPTVTLAKEQKRLLALQINDIMHASSLNKVLLAKKMNTDVMHLNRLLDPDNTSITLELLNHLARAMGKQLRIELA